MGRPSKSEIVLLTWIIGVCTHLSHHPVSQQTFWPGKIPKVWYRRNDTKLDTTFIVGTTITRVSNVLLPLCWIDFVRGRIICHNQANRVWLESFCTRTQSSFIVGPNSITAQTAQDAHWTCSPIPYHQPGRSMRRPPIGMETLTPQQSILVSHLTFLFFFFVFFVKKLQCWPDKKEMY